MARKLFFADKSATGAEGQIFRNRRDSRTWFIQRLKPNSDVFDNIEVLQQDSSDHITMPADKLVFPFSIERAKAVSAKAPSPKSSALIRALARLCSFTIYCKSHNAIDFFSLSLMDAIRSMSNPSMPPPCNTCFGSVAKKQLKRSKPLIFFCATEISPSSSSIWC